MATRVVNKFPCYYKYSRAGNKKLQMSNNISSLNARGQMTNGLETQAVSVRLNDNIVKLDVSCFANCTRLTSVLNDSNIRLVGDYAFYNCSSLKTVNFVQDNNAHELCYTGNAAFMKSGLTYVNVNTKSSVSDTGYGASCFAQCTNLTSATLTGAPFLASHMFDGCTSLKQVTLADKHSYVFDSCFANCLSLTRIDMPKNMYMLASHMFDGCINLTSITFPEDSILNYVEDHVFANCPKLTSIVLPKSINTFNYIDPEFLAGSNINKVTFKGIGDEAFVNEIRVIKDLKYETGVVAITDFSGRWKCTNENNVPMVLCLSKGRGQGCSRCNDWYSNIEDKHKADIAKTNYFWFTGEYITHGSEYSALEKEMSKLGLETPGWWVYIYLYWKKEDGTIVKWCSGSQSPSERYWDTLKHQMNSHFAGYVGPEEIRYQIKEEITTFGRGAPVTYVSSAGNSYICENNTVQRKPTYRVDRYTTSNFKYGIWYYNIEQLHAFADANNIPLVLEWSSKGCEPCKDFSTNTWNNETFLEEIKGKACLFARIEATSKDHFSSSNHRQEYYASHVLGNPNVLIPQLVFYWKKNASTTIKDVWNYNHRTDPANANYLTVLNKIDNLINTYSKDSRFVAPSIYTISDGKYKYYSNQANDNIGLFFICDLKTSVQSYNETSITIDTTTYPTGGGGLAAAYVSSKTYASITVNQEVLIPKMTYLYFNVPSGTNFPDLKGVIFKVDDKYFIGARGIYYGSDGKWHYNDNAADVTAAELTTKTTKTVITYIYKFENFEEAVDIVDEDDDRYKTGVMIDCNDSTAFNSFNDIISFAGSSEKLVVIAEMPDSANQDIDTKLLNATAFNNWMKNTGYLFIRVKSNTWSANAPKALIDMENEVQFNGNTVGSNRPKLLVFKCCTSCGIDKYGAIYCKQTIVYDSSKDINYYTKLIDDYNKLV